MPMLPPDDPSAAPWPPAGAPSPFATPPTPVQPPGPAAVAAPLDDKTVDALLLRLQEAKRRRAAVPTTTAAPSFFSRIDWDGIRKKAWHGALIIGSAYVSAKPEKYAWLMPVLTAVAGTSAPPTGKPGAGGAAVLATMLLTLGWRAWIA